MVITSPSKLLLSRGVDVNLQNADNGASPLHYAAGNGKLEIIALLLARGADPDIVDQAGQTPYQNGNAHRHVEAMALLHDLTR